VVVVVVVVITEVVVVGAVYRQIHQDMQRHLKV
jgi:hypothetical protein